MNIITKQLPETSYFKTEHTKSKIVIHHTVGGSATSTIKYWEAQANNLSTPFIIERDGTIYKCFDPKYWAYHLGVSPKTCVFPKGVTVNKGELDQASIGIEIASEGALTKKDGKYYTVMNTEYKAVPIILDKPWRDFQYFDFYDAPQLTALYALITDLLKTFRTIRPVYLDSEETVSIDKLKTFSGILGHFHVRLDKTDPYKTFDWATLGKMTGTLGIKL